MSELARRRGEERMDFNLEVHSGFRTPLHNSGVEGSARDSRHLYGDAADVAIDADGDGTLDDFRRLPCGISGRLDRADASGIGRRIGRVQQPALRHAILSHRRPRRTETLARLSTRRGRRISD